MKLNIGCGRDYKPNWENWDVSTEVKADKHFDIVGEVWPIEDGACQEIYCSGVLEQILLNSDLVFVMNQAHRVLESGGVMTVIVPSAKFSNAFKDPHDIRQFTPTTFKYFAFHEQEYKLYGSVYGYRGWVINSLITNEQGIMTIVLQKR